MDKASLDRTALIATCKAWLRQNFYDITAGMGLQADRAAHYHSSNSSTTGAGPIPHDYKLFVFGGKVAMIQVDADRFTAHTAAAIQPELGKAAGPL